MHSGVPGYGNARACMFMASYRVYQISITYSRVKISAVCAWTWCIKRGYLWLIASAPFRAFVVPYINGSGSEKTKRRIHRCLRDLITSIDALLVRPCSAHRLWQRAKERPTLLYSHVRIIVCTYLVPSIYSTRLPVCMRFDTHIFITLY